MSNLLSQQDKHKHFVIGALLGFFSFLLAIAGAVYKELHDKRTGGKFDWLDLYATIIGGFCGRVVSILFGLLVWLMVK